MAASKLREAEGSLALKELRSKVSELSTMWQKHLKRTDDVTSGAEVPSTPKKLLGSLLEGKADVTKLEEEVMTSRLKEVEALGELKELRLKVMDLETQTHVYHNQLKRQDEESQKLSEDLDESKKVELDLQTQLRSVSCRYFLQLIL